MALEAAQMTVDPEKTKNPFSGSAQLQG